MELTKKAWFTALNLSADSFANCPADADPLVWAFENNLITDEVYLKWASPHFSLPAVKDQFFELAVDKNLSEKYQGFAQWGPTFYPVYEWEDVLYVACLEPQKLEHGKATCYVLAPYGPMTRLWFEIEKSKSVEIPAMAATEALSTPPPAEAPAAAAEPEAAPAPPSVSDDFIGKTLTEIDFSGMAAAGESATTIAAMEQSTAPQPEPAPEVDLSSASLDSFNMDGFETQVAEIPPVPGAAPEPPAPEAAPEPVAAVEPAAPAAVEEPLPPAPDFDLSSLAIGDAPAPEPEAPAPPAPPVDAIAEDIDDDKTPPPSMEAPGVMVPPPPAETPAAQAVAPPPPAPAASMAPAPPAPPAAPQAEVSQTMKVEDPDLNTAAAAAYIPEEHLITEEMLAQAQELENCRTIDEAIIHIFKAMKPDFQKLLWIPRNPKNNSYIPAKAHGMWAAAPATWTTPINIETPNVFRIAFNSRMPFHGSISSNEINDQYFAIWDQGKNPDHFTAFPICPEQRNCMGFVVGAGKGPQFDKINSLRKLTNLVDLMISKLKLSGKPKAQAS